MLERTVITCITPAPGTCSSPHTAGQPKGCPYRSLSLLFNHRKIFVNLQSEAGIADVVYHFEDEAKWQELGVSPQNLPGPATPRFDLQVDHQLLVGVVQGVWFC